MTEEKKNVPEIRFPGFSEEWEEKRLGELCTFSNGINAKKEQYGHGRKFINVLDILNKNYITYNEIIGKVAVSKEVEHRNKVEYGDLLFLRSSETREEVGTTNVYLDNTFALYGGFVIRGKKVANYDPMFIKNLLNTSKIRNMISASSGGSTRYNVNQEILKKLKLKLTGINEQQKIGDFFSKLDRQIELEEERLALLEEQKKGYMQKVFSQELRFKDENGEDYPAWEEKKLGYLGETYSGLSGKTKEDFGHGNDKFITYLNVFKNTIASYKLTEKVSLKKNEKQHLVHYGDILFTTSSEVSHEVGMSSIWLYDEENVYLNSFCFGFRSSKSYINPVYLARFLRSERIRKKITILAQGSTRFNISKKELMKINVAIPHIHEQNKIVGLLTSFDNLIEIQSQKIDLLKQRKHGFLQQMFV